MTAKTAKDDLHGLKLGFIGAGKMAQAIADGLVKQGVISSGDISASAPSDTNLKKWREKGMNTTLSNDEIIKTCRIIILAVKPQYLYEAMSSVTVTETRLFVSIIAGVSTESLQELVSHSSRIVRVMPNTPFLVGAGCSVLCGGKTATQEDISCVKSMLSNLGLCVEVKESMMGNAGAIVGCGPAFMFMLIEAMADGGVKMGVPRDLAQQLAAQTMLGAAQMVLTTGRHPGQLKDEVCSPGGTTITGVHVLEDRAVRSAMIAAIEAATLKTLELGQKK